MARRNFAVVHTSHFIIPETASRITCFPGLGAIAFQLRSKRALTATMTVLSDIKTAPAAGKTGPKTTKRTLNLRPGRNGPCGSQTDRAARKRARDWSAMSDIVQRIRDQAPARNIIRPCLAKNSGFANPQARCRKSAAPGASARKIPGRSVPSDAMLCCHGFSYSLKWIV